MKVFSQLMIAVGGIWTALGMYGCYNLAQTDPYAYAPISESIGAYVNSHFLPGLVIFGIGLLILQRNQTNNPDSAP